MKVYKGSVISCNKAVFNRNTPDESVMYENFAKLSDSASECGNIIARFWSGSPFKFNDSVSLIRLNGKFKRVSE